MSVLECLGCSNGIYKRVHAGPGEWRSGKSLNFKKLYSKSGNPALIKVLEPGNLNWVMFIIQVNALNLEVFNQIKHG